MSAALPTTPIAVAMSGGVDSSVAAALLAERGCDVVGITLAMWPRGTERGRDRGCCSLSAVEDARTVAHQIGIRHYAWNLEPEFTDAVIGDFEDEYLAGRTPNPCVVCNQRIKFGTLLERALQIGATHVATGHYARLVSDGGPVRLRRHADVRKDQSYTLHRLGQDQLRRALFPLGELASKEEVRQHAERMGLATAAKPDSQDLCFVDTTVVADIRARLAGRFEAGPVLDQNDRVVGRHEGIPLLTVGQRSRIQVDPGRPDQAPLYVTRIDARTNSVTVGRREDLLHPGVTCDQWVWSAGRPQSGLRLLAQLRAHGPTVPATVRHADGEAVEIDFEAPGAPVTPGQSLVLYDGDVVLGGGRMREAVAAEAR